MFSMPIFIFWPIFIPSSPISTALWQQMHLMNYLLDLSLKHKWRLFSCRAFARERHRPKTMPWPKLQLPWAHAEHSRKMVQDLFQTEMSGSFYHLGNVVKRLQIWRNIFWGYIFLCYLLSCRKTSLHLYTIWKANQYMNVSTYSFNYSPQNISDKSEQHNQNSKSYDELLNAFFFFKPCFHCLFPPIFSLYLHF